MVKEINLQGKQMFTCEICKLGYDDTKIANDCEAFCRTHDACSIEITKKAIYRPG